MELRRYLAILQRRIWLIGLTVVVALAFTLATSDRTKVYTAKSTLYVGARSFLSSDQNGNGSNLSGDQLVGISQVIRTFATMIMSRPVAEDAIDLTGIPRSSDGVVAQTLAISIPNTNILVITVVDTNPAVAQALATGLAEAFVAKIGQFEPGNSKAEGGIPNAPVSIFERAKLPTAPQGGSVSSNLVVAVLFALMLSSGLVLLVEYLDITIKTRDDAEEKLELPVLGVVPILRLDPSTTLRASPERRQELGIVRDG